jgi:hypothetical protein
MTQPPSTHSNWPVTNELSAAQKNSAAFATSGALLMHWDGLRWHAYQSPVIGGTVVIDWPIGIWASPWSYWTGHRWQIVDIPPWMNRVNYLARVPRSDTMLAVGGTFLSNGRFRGDIFAYGQFG